MELSGLGGTEPWAPPCGGAWLEESVHGADKVMAEYIYIVGGTLAELQSKTVILEGGRPQCVEALPNVELQTEQGEVYLRPRSIYADPLRGGEHVLVLCDAFVPPQIGSGQVYPQPHEFNTRAACEELMGAASPAAPAFCAEQEYAVLDPFTGLPPGVFPAGVPIYVPGAGSAGAHGGGGGACGSYPSCCDSGSTWGSPVGLGGGPSLAASLSALPGGAAAAAAHLLLQGPPQPPRGSPAARRARQLSELHMRACIKAGLRYAGTAPVAGGACAAAAPGCELWSYRIGPCAGVEVGDQISVSRFLLRRIGEELDARISLSAPDPPPGGGDWGCAAASSRLGCHLEFSAAPTRCPGPQAMGEMQRMLSRLQASHPEHAAGYAGAAASARAAAAHAPFTVAVGDKRAAISIPSSTLAARAGPFVDRRPAADCDPYLATTLLAAGALGLPLPTGAARALARARAPPTPAAAATPKASYAPQHQPATAAAAVPIAAAAQPVAGPAAAAQAAALLLKQHPGGFGGLYAALNAAVAAGRLPGAAAAAAAPASGHGASCGSDDDEDDDEDLIGSDCGSDGEASQDLLIDEIRRIDRAARRRGGAAAKKAAPAASGLGWPAGEDAWSGDEDESDDLEGEGEEEDSACSAMASAASSPDCGGPLSVACGGGDVDMLMA